MSPRRSLRCASSVALLHSLAGIAAAQHDLRIVAYDGQQAPGLPPGVTLLFQNAWTPALNNAGHIAFAATLQGEGVTPANAYAWFVGDPGAPTPYARRGDPAPGAGAGVTWTTLGRLTLNDDDIAVLPALVAGPGFSDPFSSGLWVGPSASLSLLAITGMPAPGTPAGVTFSLVNGVDSSFSHQHAFDIHARTAFLARLQGPGTATNDYGIWAGVPGSLSLLVRFGESAPEAPPNHHWGLLSSPAMGADDAVTFVAGTSTLGPASAFTGAWRCDDTGTHVVARVGEHIPTFPANYNFGGAFYLGPDYIAHTGWPGVGGAGEVAFQANISGPGVNGSVDSLVWFSGTRPTIATLLRAGSPAPGIPGFTIQQVLLYGTQVQLNTHAVALLEAPVWDGLTTQTGVFVGTPGNVALLAATNQQAPGYPDGVSFFNPIAIAINDASQCVVFSSLVGPGVQPGVDFAIWHGSPGSLERLAYAGQQIALPNGSVKTIARISIGSGCAGGDGHPSSLNNRDQIACFLIFSDGTRAVALAEPRTACRADWDHSGDVNSADFFAYLVDFFTDAPRADFNADGLLNSQDLFDFLAAFFTPCP